MIHKVKNVLDIIDHYYVLRLKLYVKRKKHIIKQLQKDLTILQARVQFIMDFINSKIELRNKSKADIHGQFIKLNYPKLSVSMSNGITTKKNYDYLTKMPIYSLTKEKIEDLIKQRDIKQAELDKVQKTSEKDMWRNDLKVFKKEYMRFLKSEE